MNKFSATEFSTKYLIKNGEDLPAPTIKTLRI
jgi:hypothetical protein